MELQKENSKEVCIHSNNNIDMILIKKLHFWSYNNIINSLYLIEYIFFYYYRPTTVSFQVQSANTAGNDGK